MGQLVELVFEGIDIAGARALASFVVERGTGIIEMQVDGVVFETSGKPLTLPGGFDSLFVRLKALSLGDEVQAPNAGIRSFRYGSKFDLEVNVDLDDVQDPHRFAHALFDFAQDAAKRFGIVDYFAGLEPASDADTRIFTRSEHGPLRLGKAATGGP